MVGCGQLLSHPCRTETQKKDVPERDVYYKLRQSVQVNKFICFPYSNNFWKLSGNSQALEAKFGLGKDHGFLGQRFTHKLTVSPLSSHPDQVFLVAPA